MKTGGVAMVGLGDAPLAVILHKAPCTNQVLHLYMEAPCHAIVLPPTHPQGSPSTDDRSSSCVKLGRGRCGGAALWALHGTPCNAVTTPCYARLRIVMPLVRPSTPQYALT